MIVTTKRKAFSNQLICPQNFDFLKKKTELETKKTEGTMMMLELPRDKHCFHVIPYSD